MPEDIARYGWGSDFPAFHKSPARTIREKLHGFVSDASPQQIRAWDECIPKLQDEVGELLQRISVASRYEAVLEHELPMALITRAISFFPAFLPILTSFVKMPQYDPGGKTQVQVCRDDHGGLETPGRFEKTACRTGFVNAK